MVTPTTYMTIFICLVLLDCLPIQISSAVKLISSWLLVIKLTDVENASWQSKKTLDI
jgi:hypothetical protein